MEKTETVAGKPVTWTYSYDKGGRLLEAHLDRRLICQCEYDREGRRVRDYLPATAGPHYRTYVYTPDDRLMLAGGSQYSHDENGFRSIRSFKGVYTLYEYAPDYRLLKSEIEGGDRAFTFRHDEDGQRVAKYLNGELVEAYKWLDFVRLAGFHDGENSYEFAYDHGARTPHAMRRDDGAVAFLFFDQVGSLRVIADPDGDVIKEVLYAPFGGIIEDTTPPLRIPLGFAGGLHDRDLGFVRFGWRDYDVNTGRWTAPDPIGDRAGDPDWYGYCLDDPVDGVDPVGLEGGFWGGVTKIGAGLGQLWDKAPAGIGEAVTKGAKGAGKALSKTAHAFATNKDLQKYTAISLGAGALPIAAAGAVEAAPAAVAAAMQHPDKLAAASKAASDFAFGAFDKGPAPMTRAGVAGATARAGYDWYKDNYGK